MNSPAIERARSSETRLRTVVEGIVPTARLDERLMALAGNEQDVSGRRHVERKLERRCPVRLYEGPGPVGDSFEDLLDDLLTTLAARVVGRHYDQVGLGVGHRTHHRPLLLVAVA